MALRADYVPRAEHQDLLTKYEAAEQQLMGHHELLNKYELVVDAKNKLEDQVKRLEQDIETLWLQANPDEFR